MLLSVMKTQQNIQNPRNLFTLATALSQWRTRECYNTLPIYLFIHLILPERILHTKPQMLRIGYISLQLAVNTRFELPLPDKQNTTFYLTVLSRHVDDE